MNVQPFGTTIVVKPLEKQKQTASGLSLPQEKKDRIDKPSRGTVIAIGIDVTLPISKGDIVFFDKYKLADFEVNEGDWHGAISEEELLKTGGIIS